MRRKLAALLPAFALTACTAATSDDPYPEPPPSPGATSSARPLPSRGPLISVLDHGARCDGRHDDRAALQKALAAAGKASGTVKLPPNRSCRIVPPADGSTLHLQPFTMLQGSGPGSRLLLDDGPGQPPTGLVSIVGDGVILSNLALVGRTRVASTLVTVNHGRDIVLDQVELTTDSPTGGAPIHGIRLTGSESNIVNELTVSRCHFSLLSFGVFLSNDDALTVRGLTLIENRFTRNRADDIELNAPSASLSTVTIRANHFRENQYASPEAAAGFGIGLARASRVTIADNSFTDYHYSPIHIEDGSEHITLQGNHFSRGAGAEAAEALVTILSGSRDITLEQNIFDLRQASETRAAVLITAGGADSASPNAVTFRENHYSLGSNGRDVINASDAKISRHNERTAR